MTPDVAWVAGLYEGEGNCWSGPRKNRNGRQQSLSISSIDRPVLEKVKDIMEVGTIYGPYDIKKSENKLYTYVVYSYQDIEEFLTRIFPRLSERRREQACACLGKVIQCQTHPPKKLSSWTASS